MERKDKRKEGDIRKLKIQLGLCNQADGSAYVHQGSTKVLALVYGPHEVFVNIINRIPLIWF